VLPTHLQFVRFSLGRITPTHHFEPSVIDRIVTLIRPESGLDNELIRDGIVKLFEEKWQVHKWDDLKLFTSDDVNEVLTKSEGFSDQMTSPLTKKKLGFVVDYARFGPIDTANSMDGIVRVVGCGKQDMYPVSPGSPGRCRSDQMFYTIAAPTLETFSGLDEDYFEWRKSTINDLHNAGLDRFLHDPKMVERHPESAECVFYALRGAVHGGLARWIAQGILDEKSLDPMKLWTSLEEYYNTSSNRAKVVLLDTYRLLKLRLDGSNTASEFISKFRIILKRLRKNDAKIARDFDTLRAFLLDAFHDEEFEWVRDLIIQKHDSSIESILTEICVREMSLMRKDQASKVSGDGTLDTRYSRQTSQQGHTSRSSAKGIHSRSNDDANSSYPSDAGVTKWIIPKFPNSWRNTFGAAWFNLLLEWRSSAIGESTRRQLEKAFSILPKQCCPAVHRQSTTKRARAPNAPDPTDAGSNDESASQDANGSDAKLLFSGVAPRKRIKLQ
jgi:hypothetical protein